MSIAPLSLSLSLGRGGGLCLTDGELVGLYVGEEGGQVAEDVAALPDVQAAQLVRVAGRHVLELDHGHLGGRLGQPALPRQLLKNRNINLTNK